MIYGQNYLMITCTMFSLCRLGLSFNNIVNVDNGSLANVPHLRELHLNNNELGKVPGGLGEHKYIQVKCAIWIWLCHSRNVV